MNTPIIVLEIPHQMPANAWIAWGGEADVLSAAHVEAEKGFYNYELWTIDKLVECFDDEVPEEALKIAKENGEVYQINGEWFTKAEAESELDWASDVLFHDLNGGQLIYNEEDLKWCVDNLRHQAGKAFVELKHARNQIGDTWSGLTKDMIFEIIEKQVDRMEDIDLDQFETRKEAREFVEADFLSENDIDDRYEEFSCVVERDEIKEERGDKLLEVLETLGIAHHEGDEW